MIDQKVWQVQDWLNSTYGKHAQWRPLVVDGLIGWNTIFGLIRGLQVELGISTLSDAFGDTTFSRLTSQYPRISSSTGNANIKRLAQSALWCQGYLGGNTWGTYDAVLNSGLKKFSFNLGLTAEGQSVSTVFTPKMVKALMTLDSYVLLQNGSAEVREAQRWINGTYRSRKMPFLPCDGIFTRSTQQGLVTAIQYELGMTDAQANGNFGSGTKSGLAANAVVALGATDTSKNWVHLLQCALRMNGYTTPLSGTFDATTEQSVGKFKSFAELSGGAKADFPTWASLLISTGDELRKGVASDMSTPLSAQYCSALASAGYKTVGRYLSVNGKRYQPGELARIFAAGLATFPIMQEDNTYAEYFDADRGKDHAFQAIRRLRQLGFKAGATVFFAVDFDASDDTITSRIIPYFRAVAARLEKSTVSYKIGVYGTRNVCARIVDEGLAAEGFIASMSWGWGGNLGYALPPKWSYDQIRNHSLDGTDLEIDTNVQSSRAKPATSGDVLPTPLAQVFVPTPGTNFDENYFWYVTELSVRAENLIKPTGSTANWSDRANRLALLYLAQLEYNDAKWAAYAPIDLQGTIELSALTSLRQEIDEPSSSTRGRLAHMAAATRGYRTWGVPAGDSTAQIADAGGWGLDLAQAWKELKDAGQTSNIRAWAKKYIGNSSRYFGSEDLIADVDAYLIASALKSNPDMTLDEVVRQIEVASQSDSRWRFRKFINDRFGGSLSKAATAAASVYQDGILRELAGLVSDTEPPTEAQGTQLGLGFSDALRAKAGL